MEPVLWSGDRFTIDHLLVPQRGDVVVLVTPRDNLDTVKRVIAMGGDTIELREGVVLVNGRPLSNSSFEPCSSDAPFQPCVQAVERLGDRRYTTMRAVDSNQSTRPALRVPPGHVYVLGDRRDRSNDSRTYGPVPMTLVRGVAYFRYAPTARIGSL